MRWKLFFADYFWFDERTASKSIDLDFDDSWPLDENDDWPPAAGDQVDAIRVLRTARALKMARTFHDEAAKNFEKSV